MNSPTSALFILMQFVSLKTILFNFLLLKHLIPYLLKDALSIQKWHKFYAETKQWLEYLYPCQMSSLPEEDHWQTLRHGTTGSSLETKQTCLPNWIKREVWNWDSATLLKTWTLHCYIHFFKKGKRRKLQIVLVPCKESIINKRAAETCLTVHIKPRHSFRIIWSG